MRILLLGANGQLGTDLRRLLAGEVVGLDWPEFDLRHAAQVQAALHEHRPDYVINCAAQTNVDLCEDEPDEAFAINAVGAVLTGVIAIVVTSVKFTSGAYLVVILIPTMVGIMLFIRRQYDGQARELEVRDDQVFERAHRDQRVVIPVNGINRSVVQAVMFGRSLASDPSLLQAVFVTTDLEVADRLRERWERQLPGVPLVVVESPYRALVGPVVTYLDVLDMAWPPDRETPTTIVVLPEYVARHWWDRLLYNQQAKRLKASLVGREHTVIADVPYRRSDHNHG